MQPLCLTKKPNFFKAHREAPGGKKSPAVEKKKKIHTANSQRENRKHDVLAPDSRSPPPPVGRQPDAAFKPRFASLARRSSCSGVPPPWKEGVRRTRRPFERARRHERTRARDTKEVRARFSRPRGSRATTPAARARRATPRPPPPLREGSDRPREGSRARSKKRGSAPALFRPGARRLRARRARRFSAPLPPPPAHPRPLPRRSLARSSRASRDERRGPPPRRTPGVLPHDGGYARVVRGVHRVHRGGPRGVRHRTHRPARRLDASRAGLRRHRLHREQGHHPGAFPRRREGRRASLHTIPARNNRRPRLRAGASPPRPVLDTDVAHAHPRPRFRPRRPLPPQIISTPPVARVCFARCSWSRSL